MRVEGHCLRAESDRWRLSLLAPIVEASLLAGCGDDADTSGSQGGGDSGVAEAKQQVQRLYRGMQEPPPTKESS